MIEAQALTKIYDEFLAVDKISFTIAPGKVFALLGPNGAGKTTTIRMLTSILAPTSGTATVAGYDVVKQAPQVRASVGVLTEQHGLYERMKGLEYLDFFGRIYRLPSNILYQRSLELMERFGLGDALDKRIGDYSKGMKQKLALVRALLHNPPVLLLDEPTSAMDPQSARLVRDAIQALKKDNRTIVLTTHNLTEAELLADQIAVIRRGKIVANGTFDELSIRFVGAPTMELQTVQPLNGFAESLGDMVNIVETGERWIRYRTDFPHETNPHVLRRAIEKDIDVLTLSQLSRNLEDVYLEIVKEDETEGVQE